MGNLKNVIRKSREPNLVFVGFSAEPIQKILSKSPTQKASGGLWIQVF